MAFSRHNHILFIEHSDLDDANEVGGGLYASGASMIQASGFASVLLSHTIWNRPDNVPTEVLESFLGDLAGISRDVGAHFVPPVAGETQEWLDAAVIRADSFSLRNYFIYCDGAERWPDDERDYVTQLTSGVSPLLIQSSVLREVHDLISSSPDYDPPTARILAMSDSTTRELIWRMYAAYCASQARRHRLLVSGSGYRLSVGWIGPVWSTNIDPGWHPSESLILLPFRHADNVGGSVTWRTTLYHLDAIGSSGRDALRAGVEGDF